MKAFLKRDKIKAYIVHNMKDLITLLEKNIKYAVYTGENIHVLYHCLDMIGVPTTLTTSGQLSHNFGPT